MPFRIFISYSTSDLEMVNALKVALDEERSVETFVAEFSVKPGEELDPKIRAAIGRCNLFLLLWSKRAEASSYVGAEIGLAKSMGRTVLPVVLDEGLTLPPFHKEKKYLKAWTERDKAILWVEGYVADLVKKKQTQNAVLMIGALIILVWVLTEIWPTEDR